MTDFFVVALLPFVFSLPAVLFFAALLVCGGPLHSAAAAHEFDVAALLDRLLMR
jgi:hypothetical protein